MLWRGGNARSLVSSESAVSESCMDAGDLTTVIGTMSRFSFAETMRPALAPLELDESMARRRSRWAGRTTSGCRWLPRRMRRRRRAARPERADERGPTDASTQDEARTDERTFAAFQLAANRTHASIPARVQVRTHVNQSMDSSDTIRTYIEIVILRNKMQFCAHTR